MIYNANKNPASTDPGYDSVKYPNKDRNSEASERQADTLQTIDVEHFLASPSTSSLM
jgi:hypothetical protein